MHTSKPSFCMLTEAKCSSENKKFYFGPNLIIYSSIEMNKVFQTGFASKISSCYRGI